MSIKEEQFLLTRSNFSFMDCAFDAILKKSLPDTKSQIFFPRRFVGLRSHLGQ